MVGVAHTLAFEVLHEYDTGESGITVPVVLSIGQASVKLLAKLDTGASFCIFKREHGEELGLNIESGKQEWIGTAKGPFFTYGHNLSLSALGFQFDVTAYFAD